MSEHGSAEWYAAMAKLMKDREHAQQMIDRWEGKLAVFEADILALSNGAVNMTAADPAAV